MGLGEEYTRARAYANYPSSIRHFPFLPEKSKRNNKSNYCSLPPTLSLILSLIHSLILSLILNLILSLIIPQRIAKIVSLRRRPPSSLLRAFHPVARNRKRAIGSAQTDAREFRTGILREQIYRGTKTLETAITRVI